MLRSKLYEFEMEKKRAATKKIEDSKLDIEFGSQIRSYVLQPYRMRPSQYNAASGSLLRTDLCSAEIRL